MTFQEIISKLPKAYYQDDSVYIIHADCREILPLIPDKSVDLVLTDPPYEVRAGHGGGVFGERDHLVNTGGFTDGGVDYSFLQGFRNWFCFCSRSQLPELLKRASQNSHWNLITWGKPNPVPTCNNKYLPDVEYMVHVWSDNHLFGDMPVKSNYFIYPCGGKETNHPNEKPIPLIGKLINLGTETGNVILDPFLGSGTTAYCAKKLGRKCIGIEIEEKYCEIAAKRCMQSVMTLELPKPAVEQGVLTDWQGKVINFDNLPPNP